MYRAPFDLEIRPPVACALGYVLDIFCFFLDFPFFTYQPFCLSFACSDLDV